MTQIDSPKNSYIKHLIKLGHDSHYRYQENKLLLEGKKLIMDLLPLIPSAKLLTTHLNLTLPHVEIIRISSSVACALAQTETSEEVFAEVTLPQLEFPQVLKRLLVLDAVSDPGNLGTLLRTALALNWDAVFFLPGCCDPFNGKALRASQGSLFHLPYQKGDWNLLKSLAKNYHLQCLAADLNGQVPEKLKNQSAMLVLGSEGQGLSSETKANCQTISIPISKKMESLNVAAAGSILMYIMRPYG